MFNGICVYDSSRPNLSEIFHRHMEGDDDDSYPYNYLCDYGNEYDYPYWKGDEESCGEYDYEDDDECMIYFYDDYRDKDGARTFKSLNEFDAFVNEEGIRVSDDVISKLAETPICYTCVDPYFDKYGLKNLVCEESYASMYYSVCGFDEFFEM